MKKLLISVLALIMCISLCACNNKTNSDISTEVISENSTNSDYEEAIKTAIENFIDIDEYNYVTKDRLLKAAPRNFWQLFANNGYSGNIDEFFEELEKDAIYEMDKIPNKNVSYDINDLYKLPAYENLNIENGLDEKYGINYDSITEAYYVQVCIEVEYVDENRAKATIYEWVALSMSGQWYLVERKKDNYIWAIDSAI